MRILEKILGANVLYYPGCMTKSVLPKLREVYEKLLVKCGVDFIELKNEVCCGSPALNAGYKEIFKSLALKNLKVFKEHRVKEIITNCPACFKTFSKDYKEVEGWNLKVFHISQILLKSMKNGKLNFKKISSRKKITFHDPCHLGRYCGIYEEPREIARMLGYEVVEMEESKELSLCCGGGGGVSSNYPELTEEISKKRIEQAKKVALVLFTACPLCFYNLRKVSKDVRVIDIGILVAERVEELKGLAKEAEKEIEFLVKGH
ncbi:MAG: (Fe-S)-binding protein [Candidatus Aenigmarchaeota archaeon]|nr:(Fe-S)-binding protein [Candidatus Aenigmarchaeota archaeon]